jgi:hypothetical protein
MGAVCCAHADPESAPLLQAKPSDALPVRQGALHMKGLLHVCKFSRGVALTVAQSGGRRGHFASSPSSPRACCASTQTPRICVRCAIQFLLLTSTAARVSLRGPQR